MWEVWGMGGPRCVVISVVVVGVACLLYVAVSFYAWVVAVCRGMQEIRKGQGEDPREGSPGQYRGDSGGDARTPGTSRDA